MLITDDGTIIRTPVEAIRQTGRSTQGVRLMRVAEGSIIVDVARAMREEEAGEIPQGTAEAIEAEGLPDNADI